MSEMGRRLRAAEDEIEREIAEWVGPQDADAYRAAMHGTFAYQAAALADAMSALIHAHPSTRLLVRVGIIRK